MRKSTLITVIALLLCIGGLITLFSWPNFKEGSWHTISGSAWWQFEWLAAIGFYLSALPSMVVASLDKILELNQNIRYFLSGCLMLIEIVAIALVVYKITDRTNP
jgi:hypothetical protein